MRLVGWCILVQELDGGESESEKLSRNLAEDYESTDRLTLPYLPKVYRGEGDGIQQTKPHYTSNAVCS